MSMSSADLFAQLEAWRTKGYDPQLWGTPDGWVLILDMTKWGQIDINERRRAMTLRFNSDVCATPDAAIESALRTIQP